MEIVIPTEKDFANSRKEFKPRVKVVNIIKLDEAFIVFWSDAVVDPTTTEWPTFVVSKLNLTGNSNLKALEVRCKPVRWIILERIYSVLHPRHLRCLMKVRLPHIRLKRMVLTVPLHLALRSGVCQRPRRRGSVSLVVGMR